MTADHEVITVAEAARRSPVAYSTLIQAAREGRLNAWKSGGVWLTTTTAVQEALDSGNLHPEHGRKADRK